MARLTLLSACFGTLVAMVAFTAPLSTLNATVAGLDAGVAGRTWILSSMSIGLGAFLLTAGRVADDYGRRRTFVAGALLLAARSPGGRGRERRGGLRARPGRAGHRRRGPDRGQPRHVGGDVSRPSAPGARHRHLGCQPRRRHRGRTAALVRAHPARLLARRVRRAGRCRRHARRHGARVPRVPRRRGGAARPAGRDPARAGDERPSGRPRRGPRGLGAARS